jgi:DNA repair exonuclease SbcCD ATPase subunit
MTVLELTPGRSLAPSTRPDERAARRSLREQIARLEEELAGLASSSWPRQGVLPEPEASGRSAAPRVLSLAELEWSRDGLAVRVKEARRALHERGEAEEESRRLAEEMLLDPERHRWTRVSNEHLGEPGCRHLHVRPRWGLLGMLMSWWRVVVSSGCP